MKKVIPVLMAAVMAIGFSSFGTNPVDGVFYRLTPGGSLLPTSAQPCPDDGEIICEKVVPEINQTRVLYHSDGTPYKRN